MSTNIGEQVIHGIPDWLLKGIGFDKSIGIPTDVYIKASSRTILEANVTYIPHGANEIETVTCPKHDGDN